MDVKNAINLPDKVRRVLSVLESGGFEAYCVGGCVRDSLIGREPYDWDLATDALPEEILRMFSDTLSLGIKHGSVIVIFEGEQFEITTYRIDGDYKDHRHPENVTFSRSLADDLARRDFTVNAMAYSPEGGLVDLFGGQADIAAKMIRCVGDPTERFREDALRMMRAVRFAARLGYAIEPGTLAAIVENARLISKISIERFSAELRGILMSPAPGMYSLLGSTGLLAEIIPEAAGTERVALTAGALNHTKADIHARMALVLFDASDPAAVLTRLRFTRSEIRLICDILRAAALNVEPFAVSVRKAAVRSMSPDVLRTALEIKLARAISSGDQGAHRNMEKALELLDDAVRSGACLSVDRLAVNGNDLKNMGIEPGVRIGEILNELSDHVAEHPCDNSREALVAFVKSRLI